VTLTGGYTYIAAPVLSSLAPTAGPIAGGTSVTLTGSSFVSGATVTFGGTAASVTSSSGTSIAVTTPAHAAGAVDVVVTNPDSQVATLTGGFTYLAAPVLTSLTPTSGTSAGGATVTLTGDHFATGAVVTFGGTAGTITSLSATSIVANTPAHAAGAVDVVVTNPDGQASTLTGGYTFVDYPHITSISPAFGPTGGNTSVTITGTHFVTGASVIIGGNVADVSSVTATSIVATTPSHAEGAVDVVVSNPGGQTGTLTGGFTYVPPPELTSVAPTSGSIAGGTSVTVSGFKFVTGATVTFGDSAGAVTSLTATSIVAITPAHSAGPVDVTVTNPDGQKAKLTAAYTFAGGAEADGGGGGNGGGSDAGGCGCSTNGGGFEFAAFGLLALAFLPRRRSA
jgi:uncharacterized protein (TIGR03382 family)